MSRSWKSSVTSLASRALAAVFLASAVDWGRAAAADPPVLGAADRETLHRYARDTWRSFEAMAVPGELPADGLRRACGDGAWKPTEKTSPTDIAAYLWSTLAAEDLQIIEASEASRAARPDAGGAGTSGARRRASSSTGSIPAPAPP